MSSDSGMPVTTVADYLTMFSNDWHMLVSVETPARYEDQASREEAELALCALFPEERHPHMVWTGDRPPTAEDLPQLLERWFTQGPDSERWLPRPSRG